MGTGASDDTVKRVLQVIHLSGQPSTNEVQRLLMRAEPVARRACRSHSRYLRDEVLEELVQNVLLVAARRMTEVQAEDGPTWDRWVRGIARNVCRNDRRVHRELLTEDGVFELTEPNAGVLNTLLVDERDEIVRSAIEKLPPDEQDAVYHRYLHDLSRADIAEVLGWPDAEAVRVVLQRASRHLKIRIVEQLELLGYSSPLNAGSGG